jgi:prepilin peptidase CpaA
MNIPFWIALAIGSFASFDDLRRRSIANWINVAGFAAGVFYNTATHGFPGLGWSVLGALIGCATFLVFYLLGGMGAGDLKLVIAFGALLGPGGIVIAAVLAAPIGAFMAMICLLWRWRTGAIPYAPALSLGVWLALAGRA